MKYSAFRQTYKSGNLLLYAICTPRFILQSIIRQNLFKGDGRGQNDGLKGWVWKLPWHERKRPSIHGIVQQDSESCYIHVRSRRLPHESLIHWHSFSCTDGVEIELHEEMYTWNCIRKCIYTKSTYRIPGSYNCTHEIKMELDEEPYLTNLQVIFSSIFLLPQMHLYLYLRFFFLFPPAFFQK